MKQAILLMAHKNYYQLEKLINYFCGRCDIYIHLDKKSDLTKEEIIKLKSLDGVCAVYQKYKVNWGAFSILQTEMYLLEKALNKDKYGYFHLISGQDYPLKSLNSFLHFFETTPIKGFVNTNHMPNKLVDENTFQRLQYHYFMDWFNYKTESGQDIIDKIVDFQKKIGYKRRIPDQMWHLYCGSAWFSIDYDVAKYLLFYTKYKPSFYHRMRTTFVPEEVYVSTVILNSPFKLSINCNDDCREILWDKTKNVDSPQIASLEHIKRMIKRPNAFFARKFELDKSEEVIDFLDKYSIYTESYSKKNSSIQHIDLNSFIYCNGLKDAIIDFCKIMDITSVADYMCGSGWYTSYLNENGIVTDGYDNDSLACVMAKTLNGGIPCCHEIKFEDKLKRKYDLVLCLDNRRIRTTNDVQNVLKTFADASTRFVIFNMLNNNIELYSEKEMITFFNKYNFHINEFATRMFRLRSNMDNFTEKLYLFEKTK